MSPMDMAWIKARCVEDGDCLLWDRSCDRTGVPRVSVKDGTKTKTYQVRRIVWALKTGEPVRNDVRVTVTCGNKRCVCHLEAIEPGEVVRRTAQRADVKRRRILNGLRSRERAKLDMDKARAIREANKTIAELAQEFGVGETTISRIRRGVAWQELQSPFASMFAANDSRRKAA